MLHENRIVSVYSIFTDCFIKVHQSSHHPILCSTHTLFLCSQLEYIIKLQDSIYSEKTEWFTFYSCNMGTSGLPDMYVQSPRAEGIHIRQITSAHVTAIMLHFR